MIKKAVIQPQDTSTADDVDLDLGELAQFYALIPPDAYDVMLMNKKPHFIYIFGSKRLVTYWLIQDLSSEYHGTELTLSFQCPKKGKKWGALSKFAQCYRIATGRNPDRFDTGRLSPNVFKHKLFRAQVVTVTGFNDPQSRKWVERSPENYYSVIGTLLALNVG
jgi:hypothetical protein